MSASDSEDLERAEDGPADQQAASEGSAGAPPAAPQPRDEPGEQPDVYLDVPGLKVDELTLEVQDLRARVSLQAEVLDLLKLNVGVDATLGDVNLDIKGVDAQALLKTRLDNVAAIVERVLTTIDRNPQILEHITGGVRSAAGAVGAGAGEVAEEAVHGVAGTAEEVGAEARSAPGELDRAAGGQSAATGDGQERTVGKDRGAPGSRVERPSRQLRSEQPRAKRGVPGRAARPGRQRRPE